MARMVLVLACLAISACGGLKKSDEAGNASGKVLAGSISDAMINHDQSHAEAPLAGPGAGVLAGDNQAARDLLAQPGADGAGNAEVDATEALAPSADQVSKASPATNPIGPRNKSAEKAAEPAAAPAKPLAKPSAKPVAKPAVSAPTKPKPTFSKPTDDGGV